MPQFILETETGPDSGLPNFYSLDPLVRGYIEALFFTEEAPGVTTEEWQATEDHDEGSIPGDCGYGDFTPETLADIIKECENFRLKCGVFYGEAVERFGGNEERMGHDFWLTRNGHGAGFWDRSELDQGGLGDRLTTMCKEFGEVYVYLGDDGKVYVN
jgi:hypothetical protein